MWWTKTIPKHLPASKGRFLPGCMDVMLGYGKDEPFMRLFYPTDSEYDEKVNHNKWIPWIEDDNYLVGISKVIRIPILIIRLVLWWSANLHVPVLYGKKPRTEHTLKCIVMSHGLGGNRFLYSKVCCDLASHGFVVACLEHRDNSASYTYYYENDEEARRDQRTPVEFEHIPLGHKHYQSRNSQIKVRSTECSKIIDALKELNKGVTPYNVIKSVPTRKSVDFELEDLIGRIDIENFTLMGHSFGAATALYTSCLREDVKQCILLDPWMFPIKDEKLEDKINIPVLFLNTQTFHIDSNVKAMAKFLTSDKVKMYTILGTTHENQTDSVLVAGYWLNWMMRKIDPHLALEINNALILSFLNSSMRFPDDVRENEQFLKKMKEFYEEGLTKPWS